MKGSPPLLRLLHPADSRKRERARGRRGGGGRERREEVWARGGLVQEIKWIMRDYKTGRCCRCVPPAASVSAFVYFATNCIVNLLDVSASAAPSRRNRMKMSVDAS